MPENPTEAAEAQVKESRRTLRDILKNPLRTMIERQGGGVITTHHEVKDSSSKSWER